jgi:hypothetical protein
LIEPTKVIALGDGLLGWVDLWKGMVICDVLEPAAKGQGVFCANAEADAKQQRTLWQPAFCTATS